MTKIYGSLSWNMASLLWRPTTFRKVEHLSRHDDDIYQAYNHEGETKIYEMRSSHLRLISFYLSKYTRTVHIWQSNVCSSRILTTEINCNASYTTKTFKKKKIHRIFITMLFARQSRLQSILTFRKGQKLKEVQCIIIYAFQEAPLFFRLSSLH